MRKLLLLLMLGCGAATPVVKLRVSPTAAARVDRLKGQAAIETAQKALATCEGDVKKAETERSAPASVESKQRTKELDDIMRAAAERHEAMVAWRRAQCEVSRWQVASADATLELSTAEAVATTGADIDPARYRAQAAEMQAGRSDSARKAGSARTQLDQKEKALNDAKNRYAATLKPETPTQVAGAKTR